MSNMLNIEQKTLAKHAIRIFFEKLELVLFWDQLAPEQHHFRGHYKVAFSHPFGWGGGNINQHTAKWRKTLSVLY